MSKKRNLRTFESRLRTNARSKRLDRVAEENIARIDLVSKMTRVSWLGALAYFAYIGVTLVGVDDADFFIPTRQTSLPIIEVSVPTLWLFWIAPLFGSIFWVHLHLQLLKLWAAFPTSNSKPGKPLGDVVFPWLVNDLVMVLLRDPVALNRPLRRVSVFTALLLVWVFGPLVLCAFWWRSMPAHEEWMTLFNLTALLAACFAGSVSARSLYLQTRSGSRKTSLFGKALSKTFSFALVSCLALLSWIRTEGGTDHYLTGRFGDRFTFGRDDIAIFFDHKTRNGSQPDEYHEYAQSRYDAQGSFRRFIADELPRIGRFLDLAPLDLQDVEFTPRPSDWESHGESLVRINEAWCTKANLPEETCQELAFPSEMSVSTLETLKNWCEEAGKTDEKSCSIYIAGAFYEKAASFERQRRLYFFRNVKSVVISDRDLRGANLRGAYMPGITLRNVRMDEADLSSANIEGAKIENSSFFAGIALGVDLSNSRASSFHAPLSAFNYSRFVGFRAGAANFAAANLAYSNFTRAHLWQTNFSRADLFDSQLDSSGLNNANFQNARLSRASFRRSILAGTNFQGAFMADTVFSDARVNGADFRGAEQLGKLPLKKATRVRDYGYRADRDLGLRDCFSGGSLGEEIKIAYEFEEQNLQSVDKAAYAAVRDALKC